MSSGNDRHRYTCPVPFRLRSSLRLKRQFVPDQCGVGGAGCGRTRFLSYTPRLPYPAHRGTRSFRFSQGFALSFLFGSSGYQARRRPHRLRMGTTQQVVLPASSGPRLFSHGWKPWSSRRGVEAPPVTHLAGAGAVAVLVSPPEEPPGELRNSNTKLCDVSN